MKFEESKIQQSIIKTFRYRYPNLSTLLFAVPNGGARNPREGSRLKAEGVVPGVADLLLLVPNEKYHGLCIEVKTDKGRQTDNQKQWQTEVEKQGFRYIVVRSTFDFVNELTEYFEK